MVYVKTVTYSILFNGKPCGLIQPSKGIKQGDLLSPFFVPALHQRTKWVDKRGRNEWRYSWFFFMQEGTKTNTSSFADDSLLFYRATYEECNKVLNIQETYEGASGKIVDRNKTTLFFNKSTLDDNKASIKIVLGVLEDYAV